MDNNQLFKDAYNAYSSQDSAKCLELLNKILSDSPKDKDVLFLKATVLVKSEKLQKALSVLEELEKNSRDFSGVAFLKAYCYCSLNLFDQAQKELKKIPEKTEAVNNLEAQIAFKKEDYKTCLETYSSLLSKIEESHPDYNEIFTNYEAAVSSSLLVGNLIKEKKTTDSSSHDLLFNLACSSIARGDLSSAETYLEKALAQCRQTLKDDMCSTEEIEQESYPILAQLAYVQQLQGKTVCVKSYEKIIESTKNVTLSTIAENNLLAACGLENNHLQQLHKIRSLKIFNPKAIEKLNKFQQSILYQNEMSVLLALNQNNLAANKARLSDKINNSLNLTQLLKPVTLHNAGKPEEAIKDLQLKLSKEPLDFGYNFALAQLLIQNNKLDLALERLESFWNSLDDANKATPGLVGVLIWLYDTQGAASEAESLLEKVTQISSQYQEEYSAVLKRKRAFSRLADKPEDAVAVFQELLEANPDDRESLSGLIHSFSTIDPTAAEQYRDALPALKGQDATEIEANFLNLLNSASLASSGAIPAKRKSKTKCRRKNKPHKDTNPFSKPDLQRWIPMRDRTYFKSKSNKQRRGNQGAAAPVVEVKEEKTPEATSSNQTKSNKSKKKKAGKKF